MSLDHRCEEPTAIRSNVGAIFVSLELSRSTWLITSLSPGSGEKMSKYGILAGDLAALLARFRASSRRRSRGRENPFQSSSFRRRDWMVSGFIAYCKARE